MQLRERTDGVALSPMSSGFFFFSSSSSSNFFRWGGWSIPSVSLLRFKVGGDDSEEEGASLPVDNSHT